MRKKPRVKVENETTKETERVRDMEREQKNRGRGRGRISSIGSLNVLASSHEYYTALLITQERRKNDSI